MTEEELNIHIESRIQEVNSYQVNIDNYKTIINNITDEWDDTNSQYKGLTSEELLKQIDDLDLLQKVSDLNFKDHLKNTIKMEMIEQNKAKHILNALKSMVPDSVS